MDINNPDGTGKKSHISRMTIESDFVSFDFEGKVEVGFSILFTMSQSMVIEPEE